MNLEANLLELVTVWSRLGLSIGVGLSRRDVLEFESMNGVSLPNDLVTYLMTVNGMVPDLYDDHNVRFWRLEEMTVEIAGNSAERIVPFADYCIGAHVYALVLGPGSSAVVIQAEQPIFVAHRFGEFLDLYLHDTARLFPSAQSLS